MKLLRTSAKLDVSESAKRVTCPALVLHSREDLAAPFEEGRLLAGLISGARLVPLASRNHVLTEDEPAWVDFTRELRAFLPRGRPDPAIDLEDSAQQHHPHLFDKLGTENRSQAIVRARNHGFGVR